MNTETGNRTAGWGPRTEIERVEKSAHARMDERRADITRHEVRINALERAASALSDRIDALEQARALDRARLDGQSNTIQAIVREVSAIAIRLDVQRGILRTDPITQPMPAPPAPVEPAPAPETPEQMATRLLGNPEAFAAVIASVATRINQVERHALCDELNRLPAAPGRTTGLRLLAATIAAGSFFA